MALNITRGLVFKPQKVVIYGPEGIGKSTFAAKFPDPIFIDTEGSTNLMDVARLPKPTSWTMILQMIDEVKKNPGCCKTLVIDTIDWAEQLCVDHVCAKYQKKGIEDFGYGAGYVHVREEFGRFLNLLQDVIDVGINVVLTAHAQIRKFEQPNEVGSYDRYELKLGKKTSSQTSPLVKEWADMVLFANYKVHVVEIDKKKKSSGGARVMYTTHHPNWDAKNRHDLKPELPFEYEQIGYCIPNDSQQDNSSAVQVQQQEVEKKKTVESVAPPIQPKEEVQVQPKTETKVKPTISPANDNELKGLPIKLADLMQANGVSIKEIQDVVSMKGYYPQDTPIRNYDPGFIDGVLVGAWPQVFEMIKEVRKVPFK